MTQTIISSFFFLLSLLGTKFSFLHPSLRALTDTLWNASLAGGTWSQRFPALLMCVPILLGWLGWAEMLSRLFLSKFDKKLRSPFVYASVLCFFSCYCFGWSVNELLSPYSAVSFFLPFVPQGFLSLISRLEKGTLPSLNPWLFGIGILALVVWVSDLLSPPLIWDAVLDHFRFAEEVARQGEVPFRWTNHTGDMPKFTEMIWAGFWAMGGEFLSKASMGISIFLTLWILMAYPRSKGMPGFVGPLLFLTGPYFLALFTWGYVEGHLALFECLSVIGFLEFYENPKRKSWLLISLFFMGAAVGTKYTAFMMILGIFLLSLLLDYGRYRLSLNGKGIFLLAFFLCPLPWYLRNELANGNPFYPLLTGLLGGPPGFDSGMETALWTDTGRVFGIKILDLLLRYWHAFFTVDNGIGAFWPPLVFMSLPWVWKGLVEKSFQRLLIFCGIFLVTWGFLCTNLRHASGGCIALVLTASFLWGKALQGGKIQKGLFISAAFFSLGMTLLAQIQTTAPYASAMGMEDPLMRLKRNYSFDFDTYRAYQAIENFSIPRDKVLAFGVFQTYPLRRTSYVDFFWKKPFLLKWASTCSVASDLALKLKEEGATYILYQRKEAVAMSGKEKDFVLTGMPEKQYVEFWEYYAKLVITFGNCSVYQVLDTPSRTAFKLNDLPGLQENLIRLIQSNPGKGWIETRAFLKRYPAWHLGYELEKSFSRESVKGKRFSIN